MHTAINVHEGAAKEKYSVYLDELKSIASIERRLSALNIHGAIGKRSL